MNRWWTLGCFLIGISSLSAQLRPYFPGLKRGNSILSFAFQGGANNPQYNLADLDSDGKNELVVLDKSGDALQVYRYNLASKTFSLAPDLIDIFPDSLNKWLTIKDMDGDKVPDLFTNSIVPGIPGISVFKGSYVQNALQFKKFNPGQGRWEILSYQNNNGNWINVYVSPEDLPAIEDIDGDGDLDVLSFEPGGASIYYYENQASGSELFHFRLVEACWGKIIESGLSSAIFLSKNPEVCASSGVQSPLLTRHAGSSLLALDLDQDLDQDLLIGDIGSASLTALINGGTKFKAFVTSQILNFPSESTPVELPIFPFPFKGDFDFDGRQDLVVSPGDIFNSENVQVSWFYKNTGSTNKPVYQLQSKSFINEFIFDGGSEACPAFLDYNADGKMDLLVGTKGFFPQEISGDPRFILLINQGSTAEPVFEVFNTNYLNINRFKDETPMLSPLVVDYDGDGDMDLLCGDFFGTLVFFENVAGPGVPVAYAEPVFQFLGIDVGSNAMPAMVDVNGDQIPDLLVGERNGNINYFQNLGTRAKPLFQPDPTISPNTERFASIDTRLPGYVTGYATPTIIQGGKTTLVSGSVHGGLYVYEQQGSSWLPQPQRLITRKNGANTFVDFADLNGDGLLEMAVGNRRGGINFYFTSIPSSESTALQPLSQPIIKVYPNPMDQSIQIETDLPGQGMIRIYNLQGQMVYAQQNFHQHLTIDTGAWPPGIYFLSAMLQNKSYTCKLEKTR